MIEDGRPEAKKAYRNTKASTGKKFKKVVSMRKVDGFWNPTGKRQAKGSGVKCANINRVHKARS
ncbi:hypothetical protein D3C81_1904160 [compost metagenome]